MSVPMLHPIQHVKPGDDEIISQVAADSLVPVGAVIKKDFFNQRWLGTNEYGQVFSRSWQLHTEVGSLCQVVKFIWEAHEELEGEACPFDWVIKFVE